jgi:hypothetical protein
MLDTIARSALLAGLIAVSVLAWQVRRRAKRPSRRGSITAMAPALVAWIVFEAWLLAGGDLVIARWLSRIGLISVISTLLYQLWSIDYAERSEEDLRNGR